MAGDAAGGGGSAGDLQPHPVLEQLPGIQYCMNSPPPWPEAILLGFQHYLLTLGITVLIPSILVPQMGGGNDEKARAIQTLLFVSGLNTLLQSFFGTRLPNMVVGSYAFLVPATSILLSKRYNKFEDPLERYEQTMRGIQGALIVTSLFQMVVGFLGLWRNVVRLISPLSAVPLVTSTAVGLYHLGFPMLGRCVEVGCPELILMVFISQYVPHFMKSKRAIYDRYAMLFSVPIVWSYAHILTASGVYDGKPPNTQISCRTDRSGLVGGSPWIQIPSPFQWGTPTFNAGEAFAMMAASFVALIESTGTFIATSRYGSATPIPPSVISRGAGWLGIGVLLNGFFGAVTGSTISVENVGLLAVTRVGSRRVIQISAGFMIFFSVLGKFGAVFASIPLPIIAALYCVFFAYVFSSGLGFLQFCNLNSFRTKFILGFSIFMGFSIPQYLKEYQLSSRHGPVHTNSGPFNDMMTVIFMSNATVAAMIALLLDTTLSWGKDGGSNDSGSHWWRKFSSYNSDVRSDEFYALPFKLNKFFPAH
ncbi:hypothetical protein PVL29_023634 [Vitis rotundifolia]|uniref:Nucleobase-ascorbate transporter 7 n=1 Tax=Vitis rotundifolia TaxID=103349 RepID=A0AA38YPG4_VITRO|nr:hypothetical protein PVL29_023634 [Vitis rotundifolia]